MQSDDSSALYVLCSSRLLRYSLFHGPLLLSPVHYRPSVLNAQHQFIIWRNCNNKLLLSLLTGKGFLLTVKGKLYYNNNLWICIAPLGQMIQRHLMQCRRTKWVWTGGVWKCECFHTVECQQVESSRWMDSNSKSTTGQSVMNCMICSSESWLMTAERIVR